jgi:para-nitrobenzyl esterase
MRKNLIVGIFVVAVLSTAPFALPQIQNVKTTGGQLQGVVVDGVASFKGIPFAAPPVGDLRWKSPAPAKPWSGLRKADSYAAGCMQDPGMSKMMGSSVNISEDCLYLNVWTAAKTAAEKRPVMVWIHGGAFVGGMTGTPMFDGTKFAQKGVVLVSIAYRLGVFGSLAHPELSRESGKGSGTYGIQDMIAGLQWVKNNIAQFGGNPSCVTIFGESAGGIAVGMLAAAPGAKGLFQRAISESGGSFAPPRIANEAGQNVPCLKLAEWNGVSFLKKIGAADIKAARALPAEQIQKAAGGGMGSGSSFWPVADEMSTAFRSTHKATAISITSHQPGGALTGATPDGRHAHEICADGTVSPTQGRDTHDPTAVMRSALRIYQDPYQATLMNMKFHPTALKSEEDLQKLSAMIKTYLIHGRKQVQFNVVSREMLLQAQ